MRQLIRFPAFDRVVGGCLLFLLPLRFVVSFCATGQRQPTGTHAFDRVCTANRIEHRLTKPRTPQT